MEMSLDKLKQLVLEKSLLKEQDIEKVISSAKEWVEQRNIPKEKQNEYVLRRAYASFKKRLLSPAVKFKGVVIGDMGITDYGTSRKRNEILQKYETADEEQRKKMIERGEINEKGQPLYTDGFRKGQEIIPEEVRTRTLILFCMETKQNKNLRLGYLRLFNNIDMEIPMLKPVEFLALKTDRTTEQVYYLNESDITEFEIDKDAMKDFDFEKFIEKYISDKLIIYKSQLKKFHAENADNFDRFCIVKGDVVRVRKTATSLLVVLNLQPESGTDLDTTGEDTVDCWLNKPYNVDEMMMDVYIIGRTNEVVREDKTDITITGYALYSVYDAVEPEPITE